MLHDPARHEPCTTTPWDAHAARAEIERIVRDAEEAFDPERFWPAHPRDVEQADVDPWAHAAYALYYGAAGVVWALQHLQAAGAATLRRDYVPFLDAMLARNRAWLGDEHAAGHASFLLGDTGVLLLATALRHHPDDFARLEAEIAGNVDHPARELMWGAPGTMLAALFRHERDGDERWAELFRRGARRLQSQLLWSDEFGCEYWPQELYGRTSSYLDAVHGFVATASVLIRGRALLEEDEWTRWQAGIANTVRRSATVEEGLVNWRPELLQASAKRLMQFCHGAPGFVICLGDFPDASLDTLLIGAGEAIWTAGPLAKGSNLCHGTGGNGYAFLKLWRRTGDPRWLERARAFAMHGIAQTRADFAAVGRGRYSLWTGDPGFALYLRDCVRGHAEFPTLDVFFS